MKTCSLALLLLVLVLLAPVSARASEEDTASAKDTVLEPAPPPPVRLALAAGVGHAYDLLGGHLEVRSGHWAVFVGTGLPLREGLSGVLGIKAFSGPGEGFVGSLHLSYFGSYDPRSAGVPVMASLSATVGWRFRWSGAFLELGIGQSFSYAQYAGYDDNAQGARVVTHAFGFGAMGPDDPAFFPDMALAIGYEF